MKILHIVESFAAGVLTSVSRRVLPWTEMKYIWHIYEAETPVNFRDG